MKRVFSVILILVMIMTLATQAFAALPDETIISPQYTYIKVLTADLSIDESTGVSTSRATCYAASGCTVEVECKLQRYTGSVWTTLKTWTSTGSRYASVTQDWAVSSGYTYRVYATYRIRNSAGSLLEIATGNDSYAYP